MHPCTICGTSTVRISPENVLRAESGFSWEHDSTMRLLGLDEVKCSLRICPNCFHAIIFPVFDSTKLYGDDGSRVRRETYAKYYPGESLVSTVRSSLDADVLFHKAALDLKRFSRVTEFISRKVRTTFPETEELRILDWGGGDGYVSTVYASALQAVSGIRATNVIYDLTEWGDATGKRVGDKDLETIPKFHVLILSGVLEHTHDHVEMLRKATRYLHDGGIVICEVPDERYTIINAILRRQRFGLHYHVCSFSERSLHRLLERSGYSDVHVAFQPASSYRGRPIRFFVGIGRKRAEEGPSTAPGRLKMIVSLGGYFFGMAFRKMGRVASAFLGRKLLKRENDGSGD